MKLLIFLLLGSFPLWGQDGDVLNYSLQHYTDENGLPQNSVKSIAKDKNGFLWFTTEDGLVRFDGRWQIL